MSVPKRPKPDAPLRIDPNNAYARLGVSPLASTDAIRALLRDKRKAAMEARRAWISSVLTSSLAGVWSCDSRSQTGITIWFETIVASASDATMTMDVEAENPPRKASAARLS